MLFVDFDFANKVRQHTTDIISLCLQQCDCFSLTQVTFPWCNTVLETALRPFCKEKRTTLNWFCYHVTEENPLSVFLYPVNEETTLLLKEHYCDFFLNDNQLPLSLEDLCFFQNGKLMLGTVSHEYICQVFPPDTAFRNSLFHIFDNWKCCDSNRTQICLSTGYK